MKIELVHKEMVTRLKKPGEAIMETMTPAKADMLHMAGCICEEAGELFSAIKRHVFYNKPLDTANVIEELGDLEFYIEGLRQRLQLRRKQTLLANVVKLDGNRYKLGVYSDEDAQARADKTNEITETVSAERIGSSGHEW